MSDVLFLGLLALYLIVGHIVCDVASRRPGSLDRLLFGADPELVSVYVLWPLVLVSLVVRWVVRRVSPAREGKGL